MAYGYWLMAAFAEVEAAIVIGKGHSQRNYKKTVKSENNV